MKQIIEQRRAADAWDKVKKLKELGSYNPEQTDWNDKYAAYVEKLPATILTCGLGQAAATLVAAAKGRKEDPHHRLYQDLQDWLCHQDDTAHYRGASDLLQAIVHNDRDTYLSAQAEALAWLVWLKKFAVAYLKKPDQQTGGGGRDNSSLPGA